MLFTTPGHPISPDDGPFPSPYHEVVWKNTHFHVYLPNNPGEQVEENLGEIPDMVLADNGFFSQAAVEYVAKNHMEPLIAPERIKHSDKPEPAPKGRIPKDMGVLNRMRRKLKTKQGKKMYSKRKESVEPVFGQIKEARGIRSFILRGLEKVQA